MTRLTPFQWGLSVSVLVHGILFLSLGRRGMSAFDPVWATPDRIDVDLTRPYRLTSDPTQTFRSPHPGTGRPMVVKPTPGPFQEGGGVAPKGREWTLPAPGTKGAETPLEGNPLSKSTSTAEGTGTVEGESRGLGGLGTGGEGEVDWVFLTERPRLLNRDELVKNIRRFYPEAERRAGREGSVTVHVHLNRDGRVAGAGVARSAGFLFDEAAQKVIASARFSPARRGDRAVSVKFVQTIDFQLED
ncbi:MAG: energy transducer TonB [Elusimicrobia bacterium]|jgi:TonB family protein|nr:energy transducer TonB [Elusimicrobiota bacterium]MBK7207687.1 energy transducer TonB [Elusimicrobiota bacterium]MBK7544448.1 energy transducer TonB [Elusimicrobiota bacterium]MBK7573971.1 energy transducer TonB [Elusimicrobiota bacterium]MBK7689080.1 energy transducer TonB [Elusimicrobiota bacterium]